MNPSRMELATRARGQYGSGRPRKTSATGVSAPELGPPLAAWPVRHGVWAPLAVRGLALVLALLGLAGIGSVAARAPRSQAPGVVRAALELGALPVPGFAAGVAQAWAPELPDAAAPQAAVPPAAVSPAAAPPAAAPAAPASGAPCPPSASAAAEPDAHGPGGAAAGAPVVLNRADAAELQRLPGIGAKRAEAILALRQRLGRFRRISDLTRVKGIGPRTLERIRPQVVLD